MQRVTITLEDELLTALDRLISTGRYQNRSEAVRDLVRAGLAAPDDAVEGKNGVAALVYVYDHETRQLAKRLTHSFHERHDLSLATMHVHLDHESCLEVAVLRGAMSDLRHFAEHVIAERGVRHGQLVLVPVELAAEAHMHGGAHDHRHLHTHVREAG